MPNDCPPTPNFQLCIALYDNSAESSNELSFSTGDILTVIKTESPGHEGWWVCWFRGKEGIIPSNRVRMLTEAEHAANKELKRRSWENYWVPNVPVAITYDSPAQRHVPAEQYDVPPAQPTGESYDIPKPMSSLLAPLRALSLTPSSSISSLTTDSNRSSLVQQDYDVPRPSRVPPQGVYDVPKGGEVALDMNSALEWLGRLEADVTGAISRLLGLATAGWRTRAKMESRMVELKGSVSRLGSSLHDLTVFTHAVLATHHGSQLGLKLGSLVAALNKADLQVKECIRGLEGLGWSPMALSIEETDGAEKEFDPLDKLVQTAAALTDDIRAIASFIQGNSTLLFKRETATTPSDSQYMNLTGGRRSCEDYVEPEPTEDSRPAQHEPPVQIAPLSLNDRKVIELYGGHYWSMAGHLAETIDVFLSTITNNEPPKAFLAQCKVVELSGIKLLLVGEAMERSIECPTLKSDMKAVNRLIFERMSELVDKTMTAAAHFPSVRAVQRMVDAVHALSSPTQQFSRTLQTACSA